jgi:hypothetical protein
MLYVPADVKLGETPYPPAEAIGVGLKSKVVYDPERQVGGLKRRRASAEN